MKEPGVFLSHGAPGVALEEDAYTRALSRFASAIPTPEAIVVISAHWEARGPVRVGAAAYPALIDDFGVLAPALSS